VAVGASNDLPDDVSLSAFADRFLLRVFVDPIPDPRIEELLAGGWALARHGEQALATVAELDTLAEAARHADLDAVRPHLAHALRRLRRAGITLSDRRAVKVQKLIAAAAVIDGRWTASDADLWPLICALPTFDEQQAGRDELRDLLAGSRNVALEAAAAEASLGPLARAQRIVSMAEELFSAPVGEGAEEREGHRLRLEGLAREIDAGFALDALPADLARVRERITKTLEAGE
jgi:MoxR-like ATPase